MNEFKINVSFKTYSMQLSEKLMQFMKREYFDRFFEKFCLD